MNPLLILKVIQIAASAAKTGKDVIEVLKPIQEKLERVQAENRDITPAEFEELEASIAVLREELHA